MTQLLSRNLFSYIKKNTIPECGNYFSHTPRKIFFALLVLFSAGLCEAGYQINFKPRLSVETEYTDNLYLSGNDKIYDFINVITPGITASVLGKTRGAELSYDVGYSCYSRFSENNGFRHRAELNGWMGFSRRTRMNIQNSFLLTEEPGDEFEEEEEEDDDDDTHTPEKETVRRKREVYYTNTMNIGFTHQFGRTDSVSMKYIYSILENKDVTVEDKSSHKPSVNLVYWFVPERLGIETGLDWFVDESSGTPDSEGSLEKTVTPSAGIIYWIIPRQLKIAADISYEKGKTSYDSDEPDEKYDIINPSIDVEYDYIPDKLGINSTFAYKKGSSDTDESYDFTEWKGSITVTKTFTRRFEAFFQYAHTIMDFEEDSQEDYVIYDPSVGIKYIVARDVTLSFSIWYVTRDTKGKGNESDMTINGDLGRTWNFSRYGSLNFKASSGYDESYFGADRLGFGIFYDASVTAEYSFTRYITGDIFGAYKRDRYTELDSVRNDETKDAGLGITFRLINRLLSVRVGYLYREVDSTSEENSYKDSRFSIDCMLSPLRPFRTVQ